MATVSRHGNAPFANGETLSGTELEADFNTIYTDYNGNIKNANIASNAEIGGTKLGNNTITSAKMLTDTIEIAKMAASAVPKFHVDTSISTTWTTGTSLTDITNCTDATLTPGSTNDMIFMDICLTISEGSISSAGDLTLGWHINGTDFDNIHTHYFDDAVALTGFAGRKHQIYSTYMILAPATTSMTIKPRHKRSTSSSGAISIDNGVFRCWILPGKA